MAEAIRIETQERAARSGGGSDNAIYRMVARALEKHNARGAVAVDLGCGRGALHSVIASRFKRYVGIDAVRYDGFPSDGEFVAADLNAPVQLESKMADGVFAVETIEHLENPRALFREIARVAKPGGWILVTTPNQLSGLSIGTLAVKRRFSAFQEVHYPAHITALLETDLVHMAREVGLREIEIEYSGSGRIALTRWRYPRIISAALPRLCSDNVLLIGRAP
jgi:2-polyprenyl-3-methyl-5-hydroxy-6-metoxy-1,4-benzoquinol methylase